MRVYELSKQLGVSNKRLIKLLNDYGAQVRSHMSKISDEVADGFKKKYTEVAALYQGDDECLSAEKVVFEAISKDNLSSIFESAINTLRSIRRHDLSDLSKAHKDGDLVLVLGAGVSSEYSLPHWNELLQNLMISSIALKTNETIAGASVLSKIFTRLFNPDPLIAGRFLQDHFSEEEDDLTFENAVRTTLYKNFNESCESELVKEIVQFCIAPGKTANLNSIITYNYDDIIETALNESGLNLKYSAICQNGINPESDELAIYHVHGFLPRNGKLTHENRIIFSEKLYHDQYADMYHWSNIVQINKFRENTCLFMGVSMKDPNLRRILDISRKLRGDYSNSHYCIKKKYKINDISRKLLLLLNDGIQLSNDQKDPALDLEATSDYLIKIIESFEEKDMETLGVSIIWIDSYSEIPEILKNIRK